ncbi:MAG: DUF3784 domain-containing protein [Methanomassiliicoccaceae archaeon]|nr:DUF3784 domain-containing protein [Methanomassiliicoccaceae archaeon]
MPVIEGREKGFRLMQLFWVVVIAAAVYAYLSDHGLVDVLGFAFMAGVLQLCGSFVYRGHVGMLAGYNTMSPEEQDKYDMVKMSSFLGICWVTASFVSYTASVIALYTIGWGAAFALLMILFLAPVFFSVFYVNTKKFKK